MRAIAGSAEQYALIAFDEQGHERKEGDVLLSDTFPVPDNGPTDIFVEIHGWMGDMPAAITQYDRWFGAMAARTADRAAMASARPGGFRPVWIGLHWPSLPWGDEEKSTAAAFALDTGDALVDAYARRLGDRAGLRDLLRTIVGQAEIDPQPLALPPEVETAYREIDTLLTELPAGGVAAPPGEDRAPFDPQQCYQQAQGAFGLLDGGFGDLLMPLRQLSFWSMKKRARLVGEGGFHSLLTRLSQRFGPGTRFHLMGHSFGCIAASAAVCGPANGSPCAVSSLALVQGALSLWSYTGDIPYSPGGPGYFRRLLAAGVVRGPIVTTRSRYDRAVGTFYPIGAGIANQIDMGLELPRFGGLGSFGAQGLGGAAIDMPMPNAGEAYGFSPARRILNLEASDFIRQGGGVSGAHSDIAGAEVAHAVWSAAIAS